MGRLILYTFILVLAVFLLATVLVFRHGEPSAAVSQVSVHDLSTEPEAHAGQRVETTGVLRLTTEPEEEFVLADEGLGIVIRGYDEELLRHLQEREVRVTGRFGFNRLLGTYIDAELVTPLD